MYTTDYSQGAVLVTKNEVLDKAKAKANQEAIATIANYDKTNDHILMTTYADYNNDAELLIEIHEGVSSREALMEGNKNHFTSRVKRVVARVIVTANQSETTNKDGFDIKDKDGVICGKLTRVQFAVAQGGRGFTLGREWIKKGTDRFFYTPGFDFIPGGTDWPTPSSYPYAGMAKWYDYSDLFEKHDVGQLGTYSNKMEDLKGFDPVFVFPNNHKVADDRDNTGFRKANTAYVLVKGKFVPKDDKIFTDVKKADLAGTGKTYDGKTFAKIMEEDAAKIGVPKLPDGRDNKNGGDTFYIGDNGKLYKTAVGAVTEALGGVTGQGYRKYLHGAVYYYAWLNPDNINDNRSKAINSPVLRNNVYHVHINSFLTFGHNWNPLYPEDPKNPNPNNPDPCPDDNPVPPVNPDEPLTNKDIYMSVNVEVLDWDVHSYAIDLEI
ncbi:MAG: Mfa1 family fimbria major subunit [Porphyromonadaceae bacterium]|nr:Mfa1 family fimbria major subunit [Porphyromonadaceae bacterium]